MTAEESRKGESATWDLNGAALHAAAGLRRLHAVTDIRNDRAVRIEVRAAGWLSRGPGRGGGTPRPRFSVPVRADRWARRCDDDCSSSVAATTVVSTNVHPVVDEDSVHPD
ncbi:unnamed protein product [Lampetra planeri]